MATCIKSIVITSTNTKIFFQHITQVPEDVLEEEVATAVGLDPWGLEPEEEALLADVEAQRPGQPALGRGTYLKVCISVRACVLAKCGAWG